MFVISTGTLALAGAVVILWAEFDAASRDAEQILRSAAALSETRIAQSISTTRSRMEALVETEALQSMDSERCGSYLRGAGPALPEYSNIFIADIEGHVLCRGAEEDPGLDTEGDLGDVSTRPWWPRATHPDSSYVTSEPFKVRFTDNWAVMHTLPIRSPEGARVGYLGVSQPVQDIVALLESESLPEEHIVTVSAADGHVIARSSDLLSYLENNVSLPQSTPPDELYAFDTGFNESPSADGTLSLWAFDHMSVAPWTVYVGVPKSWITNRALRAAWPKLLLIALLFAAPVVLGGRVLRSITRSITTVLHWSKDPDRAGREPAPTVEIEEVRQLAGTFEETLRERNQAAAAEHAALQRVQSILNNAVFGIYISDADGRFIDSNPAIARMLGYESTDDLSEIDISSLYVDPAQRAEVLTDALAGRRTSAEVEWMRRDGTRFPVRLNWRKLDNGGGSGIFEVIAEDVSERKELEVQLRQSQKLEAIGRLAGGVAHDFNNRLTVISGQAEMLLEDIPEGHPYAEYARLILDSAERSAELTSQLLAFSRRQLQRPQVIDLNSTLETVRGMVQRLIGEDIEVTAELAPEAKVIADAGQMEQILMNLCTNARDAMPEGGRLLLKTECRVITEEEARSSVDASAGPYVVLSVVDTGEGMDEETRSRIFEPFFTTKPAGKGTGLGLSTVYGIVSQTGGVLRVFSTLHEGTRFEIWLPRASGEVARPNVAREPAPGPLGRGETILVAEDEAPVRQVIVTTLNRAGYNVLAAEDGYHALTIAASHPERIDLLLTDVLMPGMKGPELADRLLNLGTVGRVLFVSGYADDSPEIDMDGLPWDFMPKPFTGASLGRRVRALLDMEAYLPTEDSSPATS